jgi:PAS domain S-box-containing protein
MGALMATIDWSRTPLGPVSGWSQALRTMVGLLLRNRFPLLLWWGPQYVQFYNDAYRPIAGQKHPRSMAQPASECFREIWHIIGPMIDAPFRGEPATTSDDLSLLYYRRGFLEEAHFKVAYSPVPDETVHSTGIGGVIATVAETTEQVLAERQLRTLRELGSSSAHSKTAREACVLSCATLEENTWDIPFALFYLLDADGHRATLAASVGFEGRSREAAPEQIELAGDGAWPLGRVVASGRVEVIRPLGAKAEQLPRGRWSEAPREAIALPLASPDQAKPYGVMICGVSPHRLLDEGYRAFFDLAAQQVVTAIRNARALEEERRRAEMLAEIDRAKTAFFSNVSHEFRTPLALLLGPLEESLAALKSPADFEQRQNLAAAHRNALRLLRLVNTLLDFSRIEAGRAQSYFEPVDLSAITEDLASVFRSAVERGGLSLTVDCAKLDEPVWVDRDMWEKIVLNLLSNAFKFTFEGGLTVRLRALDTAVILEVSDTGVGIPREELPRLFERFRRIQGTRSRSHEGTGIGLALVHDLVKLHGGRIDATSVPGKGTTFAVGIPRGRNHLPADRVGHPRQHHSIAEGAQPYLEEALRWLPEAEERTPVAAPPASERGARILLADDNADMRSYMRRLLAPYWVVETAADGREALDKLLANPPDLVLSDVMMPGVDGFQLLREIRENPARCETPVILLSGRAGEESKIEGLGAGADDYLIKPFAAQELVARVESHLRLARLRREAAETVRQSEHRLRLLLEQTPLVHWTTDANLVYTSSLGKGLAAVGLKPGEAVGRNLLDYHAPHEPIVEAHRGAMAGRSTTFETTYAGRVFECYAEPMRDAAGQVTGVLGIALDRTERAGAEEEIRRLNTDLERRVQERTKSLEETIRELNTFAYSVAHDLRAPLRAIHGFGQLVLESREATAEDTTRFYLTEMVSSAARMDQLIQDLLGYSSLNRGDLAIGTVALDGLVDRVLCDMSAELKAVKADVRVERPLASVHANDLLLRQAVSNLVSNAIKFVDAGIQPQVRIRGERQGSFYRLVVEDNGIGIAPAYYEKVFRIFERLHSRDAYPGTGIGLAIVRRAVERMGGKVGLDSEAGKGSRFHLDLPTG